MTDIQLFNYMKGLLDQTPEAFTRYIYDEIDWQARMVGIVGPRGVGKSTMLLQRIRRQDTEGVLVLYVMADSIYFDNHSLVSLADEWAKEGGHSLFIDEVHKYEGWSRELKQIYDVHPDMQVVFTGSSVLDILQGEADLSRRALIYHMQGLSFREYLQLFHDIQVRAFGFEEILNHEVSIPGVIHPLPLFNDYLQRGYYPFALEGNFERRMQQILSLSIEVDIPQYADMKASTARKLKQMMGLLSTLAPYKPSYEKLAAEIGVSKNNVPDYLVYLERAGLIGLLRDDTSGMRSLGKVEKLYIDNPSLLTVLGNKVPEKGTLRETFFYNQMRVRNSVSASRQSDFVVNGHTFEVGGAQKGKRQIEGIANGHIVRDDIESGHGIIHPLWHFGMNY